MTGLMRSGDGSRPAGGGRHENGHTFVVIAAPVVDEIAVTTPGDDRPRRRKLLEQDPAGPVAGPMGGDIGSFMAEPSCGRSPPAPKGLSMSSPGPEMNPSRDIDM